MLKNVVVTLALVAVLSLAGCAGCMDPCNQPNPCNPCQEGPVYSSPCCPAPSAGMGY
mgnify:CR=1 FL=1